MAYRKGDTNMKKLTTSDLLSLEEYDKSREEIKKNLLSHKKNRSIKIGDNVLLLFEDYETIKYQVQEMLRIEKIFREKDIQEYKDNELNTFSEILEDKIQFKDLIHCVKGEDIFFNDKKYYNGEIDYIFYKNTKIIYHLKLF